MNTREPQYQRCLEIPAQKLGILSGQAWHDDPKRLLFGLARYKFVAQMLKGREVVAEVGCGDGWYSRLVDREVGRLRLYDFDPVMVADANNGQHMPAYEIDITKAPLLGMYDGIYSLDCFEHIAPADTDAALENVCASLEHNGVVIIGMPSLESQVHASPLSKAGHVNCLNGEDFRALMQRYFHSVLMFSMNDEVVHTGFMPMAHYLFAVCSEERKNHG